MPAPAPAPAAPAALSPASPPPLPSDHDRPPWNLKLLVLRCPCGLGPEHPQPLVRHLPVQHVAEGRRRGELLLVLRSSTSSRVRADTSILPATHPVEQRRSSPAGRLALAKGEAQPGRAQGPAGRGRQPERLWCVTHLDGAWPSLRALVWTALTLAPPAPSRPGRREPGLLRERCRASPILCLARRSVRELTALPAAPLAPASTGCRQLRRPARLDAQQPGRLLPGLARRLQRALRPDFEQPPVKAALGCLRRRRRRRLHALHQGRQRAQRAPLRWALPHRRPEVEPLDAHLALPCLYRMSLVELPARPTCGEQQRTDGCRAPTRSACASPCPRLRSSARRALFRQVVAGGSKIK